MNKQISRKKKGRSVPLLIHIINLTGSVLFWLIFYVCASSDRVWRDVLLIFGAAVLYFSIYYRFRKSDNIMSIVFSLSLCFFIYIVMAESLFKIENITGFNISRRLDLSGRLLKQANQSLIKGRNDTFENISDDPLFYHRVPGSMHRYTYDGKGKPYEIIVDETGYLNLDRGYYDSVETINIFVSGDSVLQGAGLPSCLQKVKEELGTSIWNLSTGNYSPRQKVKALLTYSLQKKPRYIVIEFFSGNDASDCNEDEIIESFGKSFETRFSKKEMQLLFERSQKYEKIMQASNNWYQFIRSARINNLTLSLTYELVHKIYKKISNIINASKIVVNRNKYCVAYPVESHFKISEDLYEQWIEFGLENTIKNYQLLVDVIRNIKSPPKVILMYNPSSYEIYQGILVKSQTIHNNRAEIQLKKLRAFAENNNWIFMNLLPSLREKIQADEIIWLYGDHDVVHWSPLGTEIVAEIISQKLERF